MLKLIVLFLILSYSCVYSFENIYNILKIKNKIEREEIDPYKKKIINKNRVIYINDFFYEKERLKKICHSEIKAREKIKYFKKKIKCNGKKTIYKYNKSGILNKITHFDGTYETFEYRDNKLYKRINFGGLGCGENLSEICIEKYEYKYNNKGQIIEIIGNLTGNPSLEKYYYKEGNLVSIISSFNENRLTFSTRYDYKYDLSGNLIEEREVIKDKNDKMKEVYRIKISYDNNKIILRILGSHPSLPDGGVMTIYTR